MERAHTAPSARQRTAGANLLSDRGSRSDPSTPSAHDRRTACSATCRRLSSVVDGLEGAAFHLAERINLVVIAKTSLDRLGTYAQERGWRNLRLLSSRNNTFNRDYHAEAPDGGQLPVLNVFSRDEDGIHHHWASEMMTFKRGNTSSLDPVWPIYSALDLTREGRRDSATYPSLQY